MGRFRGGLRQINPMKRTAIRKQNLHARPLMFGSMFGSIFGFRSPQIRPLGPHGWLRAKTQLSVFFIAQPVRNSVENRRALHQANTKASLVLDPT